MEKDGQTLSLRGAASSQCQVNLGEGWPDIVLSALAYQVLQPVPGQPWRRVARHCVQCFGLPSKLVQISARSTLEKDGQMLVLCTNPVSASSISATLEKGALVLSSHN